MPLPARAVQCTTGKTLVNPQAIANQTVAAINHFVVAAKITFSAFANMENNRLWEDGQYKCAGLLATFYRVIDMRRRFSGMMLPSRREAVGHKMQSRVTVWMRARFFGTKNA